MTRLLALDTNAYVSVMRGLPNTAAILREAAVPTSAHVVLGPVIAELIAGARTAREAARIDAVYVRPVAPARRLGATYAHWAQAGAVLGAMRRARHDPAELAQRSFFLDVVVAVVCRAHGVTLMTDDGDHARIRPYVGHATMPVPAA